MSKTTTPNVNQASGKASAPTSTSSAWSRGPPTASATSTPIPSNPASGSNTPAQSNPSLPNGVNSQSSASNGPNPVPIAGGGHSRKSSMLVGGGMDIKRGSIAFGTVDHPNPMLSSSPAAPSTTGSHLSDAVKSFGSIDADASNDSNAVKTKRMSSLGASSATSPVPGPGAVPPKKNLDLHSLFAGKPHPQSPAPSTMSPQPQQAVPPTHDRRQSMGQSGFQPGPNGLPGSPYTGAPHLRPPVSGLPNQQRSPVLNQAIPPNQFNPSAPTHVQQGFRPPQQGGMPPQQAPVRPNGVGPQGVPRPGMMMGPGGMGAYGMHPGPQGPGYPMMQYPQQNYYPGYNPYEQQQYNQQWAPQQHPQNQQYNSGYNSGQQQAGPMSPRAAQGQLPSTQSPMPPSATLPSSGGASPVPTPPTRPPSLMSGHQPTPSNASNASIPVTPQRPMPPTFTPQQAQSPSTPGFPPHLSGAAVAFTPRRSTAAIKISRPDGSALDLKAEAAAKAKTSPVPSSGAGTPELGSEAAAPQPAEAPKKKLALPIVVRIESEEQKKIRLAEEADKEKLRLTEEREEKERQERKEKKAKEEEERKAKEAAEKAEKEKSEKENKEKADAEAEKKKLEQAFAAEQAAAEKAAAEKEANAKALREHTEKSEQEKAAAHAAAQEAREKADDQRRALMTPVASTPPSPLASPALGAGLPAKPVAAINGARRPPPSALDLKPSSPSLADESPSASQSALNTAKPIEDLTSIVYPASTKSPQPQLNVGAEPGKFRYDRDFLMQFMGVCREKPDSLPPLEEIGLEADASSGFGNRGSRGGRNSMGPSSRSVSGAPTGLGIGGINRPAFPGQGMGSFGMGQFGSGSGSLRGTTSEQRYQATLRAGSMGRSPSQGGPGMPGMAGLPSMGPSTSRSGASRGSQRGTKRAPQEPRASLSQEPAPPPLQVSGNAWTRTRLGGDDEGSPAFIERKVKSLLNKLTEEKFDGISKQILEWANKSQNETDGMTLKLVIKLIFDKATDEAHWSAMYAKLCRMLMVEVDPNVTEVLEGKPTSGGVLFRKYLLGRCQMDFESGWKAREDTAVAAAAKSEEDKERLAKQQKDKEAAEKEGGAEGESEAVMMSDEYYAAQKAKRRGLGLVQLIGELYKLEMVSKGVIRQCLIRLLGNVTDPDEEDIESTCKLLSTIGEAYDRAAPDNMNTVFERLQQVVNSESISSRIKFMIMDIMDLRKAKWKSRNKQAGVMTIAEIHQQAAQEKAAAAAQAAQGSISRGGSRAGRARDGPQPGEWQSVSANPRAGLGRPADFSNIGRNISSTGMPSAPTFGPSSVFARKGKAGAAGTVTPPLSRQPSSANMFSALNDASEAAPAEGRRGSADASEPAPQRKKLQLAPRTKPLPGDGEEGEGEGEGEEEEGEEEEEEEEETPAEEASAPKELTEAGAKLKITSDMKELWGEKDQGGSRDPEDIAEYFRTLPEIRRHLLAERLLEDVFRIAKEKDAKVVAKGWKAALEADVVTSDVLRTAIEARMPSLDDDSLDFPAAYKAIGFLIRPLSLSPEEVSALGDKIDVYGEPKITPKQKLEKAIGQVAEEEASA
ncbi:hypothetical protein I302_106080 [Kwoniella bestiolae CBS 10118]|uniref:Translation initiation factor 4G n=1 Tax=Kwoniella bestiolae CBS 10118 TaxID=1296100 RepID=A0A1B9G2Y5_9TREE|nr:translation initiation factor 4G [Kwoniella bestiolae CBS 10118]OCF25387.1 translation initiation factor 4G [Kwoniella bestiolae CBS 10118]